MIKANELRIGIQVFYNGAMAEVKGFIKNDDSLGTVIVYIASEPIPNYSRKPVSPRDIDPIPLTPEWLERIGFNAYQKVIVGFDEELQYSYRNHNLELTFTVAYVRDVTGADITRIRIRLDGEILFVPKAIVYLHQLQNLFFALTGEELTINNEHLQVTS